MNDDELVLEIADVKTCPHQFVFWMACQDCLNNAISLIKRAADNSCCICCDDCLRCDATKFLRRVHLK
jgi:hypothetical protein